MTVAVVYPLLVILYLLSLFVPFLFLQYIVGGLSLLAIALSAFRAKGLYFYTECVFLVVGVGVFIRKGLPWHEFLLQFEIMLGL
jgi:hypothetical protein